MFYNTVKQNRTLYTFRCVKCRDTFESMHSFSNRKSCRLHSYVRNNKNQLECLDCHKIQYQSNSNCYHIGKKNELLCTIL